MTHHMTHHMIYYTYLWAILALASHVTWHMTHHMIYYTYLWAILALASHRCPISVSISSPDVCWASDSNVRLMASTGACVLKENCEGHCKQMILNKMWLHCCLNTVSWEKEINVFKVETNKIWVNLEGHLILWNAVLYSETWYTKWYVQILSQVRNILLYKVL